MKCSLAATSLLTVALVTSAAALNIGDTAPDTAVKLKNSDGKDITIAGVKGEKGTLVVFSCNGCPYARAWETRIVELGNAYSKKGVGAIMINSNAGDSVEAISGRAKERGFQFPYVA